MSQPRPALDVKLIMSIFSRDEGLLNASISELRGIFGPVEWISPLIFFDRTRYYEREMGWPLLRRFLSFEDLIPPDSLVEIKHRTNALEDRYRKEGKRLLNIDPGYIALERLVLATGKNYTHRIYLGKGIYGDLTLIYHKGSFMALPWTYPDYGEGQTIGWFNRIRERYKDKLRERACLGV